MNSMDENQNLAKQLTELALTAKNKLNIEFNDDGVKYLEGFIERVKSQFSKEDSDGIINTCGAFFGQCIIENYGGKWMYDENNQIVVSFGEKNNVYPISKTRKQFENGLDDSIYSMYSIIPLVFKL